MIPIQTCSSRSLSTRGFTLIETMLAMVLGSMVLAGCFGVFLSIRNMDNTFEARFQRTSELDMTHTVLTRALLGLQMAETESTTVRRATDADEEEIDENVEPDPRPRIILETDPSVLPDSTGWAPQRFELVTATPPAPASLASQAASWYITQDNEDSLDYSASDGSQGSIRGVFELRPAGQRELIMHRLGLIALGDPMLDQTDLDQRKLNNPKFAIQEQDSTPNWTLWWRPILSYEGNQLLYGTGPLADTQGNTEEIRQRLAGAIPLMRGIERCIWEIYKSDEFITIYQGSDIQDIPAYAQFEVILNNSQYASWMFEVDWVFGDDPNAEEIAGLGNPDDADANNGNGNNNGNNNNGRPNNGGPPPPTTTIDFSGDS